MPVPSHTLLQPIVISNADQNSYTSTLSYSPAADRIVHAMIYNRKATSAAPVTPTLTGGGVTGWSLISTMVGSTDRRLSWFSGVTSGSPPSEQLVLDFAGELQTAVGYALVESTNVVLTGTNGVDSFIQAASTTGTGTAVSGTFGSAWEADDNRALVAVWYPSSGGTVTWGTGFTSLGSTSATGLTLFLGYGRDTVAGDTTIDTTLGAGGNWGFHAFELNALGSSVGSAPVVQSAPFRLRGMNGRFN